MKLVIATDHRGVEFKKELIRILKAESDFDIVDESPDNYPRDDYPDFAFRVGRAVSGQEDTFGVLVCASGIGMSIAANKVKGIRCALVKSMHDAKYSRRDDDANIIAMDAGMNPRFAAECIKVFVRTPFCTDEEKYVRRRNKVLAYESGTYNEL